MTLKANLSDPRAPIGVFDSGVGGLTVARAIVKIMPHENLVYFGDTAHLPYGDKSPTAIRHYAETIARFLLLKKCKAIVIACNTASAYAFRNVKKAVPAHIPVLNVIDPVVAYCTNRFQGKKIGIIATKGTVSSGVYTRRLEAKNKNIRATAMATPLLVPIIEEDFLKDSIRLEVVRAYLNQPPLKKTDALVLGCTHYPLIASDFRKILPASTQIVDSASVTALALQKQLEQKNLLLSNKKKGTRHFYVSDYTPAFEKIARRFFGDAIHLRKADIWS